MTNDVNFVNDNIIKYTYCKKKRSTILRKLSDPVNGIKVFEQILLLKGHQQFIYIPTSIKKTQDLQMNWQSKYECLELKMKKYIESTKYDINTRHISIQNQNQMDITCTNVGVGEKENISGINKKVSTDLLNNIIPENFKTPKLYQQFINGENKNLTESVSEIKTTQYKEIKTNIPSTQVITLNGNPDMLGQPNVEVLVLNKDAQLMTMRIKSADWKNPEILKESHESVPSLPVAIIRALKPNLSPSSG